MFESLVAAAVGASGAAAVGAWARVENVACARRLAASADMLEARLSAAGSAERDQWCLDNWDSVSAEVAAEQNVSNGVASHQLLVAISLRERLPRVEAVFATGALSYRLVAAIVSRTRLVRDRQARAELDAAIAAAAESWTRLSATKTETAIDALIDRIDPGALRRTERSARGRHLDIVDGDDGSGLDSIEGSLLAPHSAALKERLRALIGSVCGKDPRTVDQLRADAMGAMATYAEKLGCECGDPHCPAAAAASWGGGVIHGSAEQSSLADDTPVQFDGAAPPLFDSDKPLRERTIDEVSAPEPLPGPAHTNPAAIIGGGILPAPLLAAKLAATAVIRPLIHPGDAPPEPRYTPSRALADFVRCRDMTCRFPGCDEPAYRCDLDHTIGYPVGPTCASNLACLCRKHHLLKTFWGWSARQLPDGTLIWSAPNGRTYTTYPGARLLFPQLCAPTAPIATPTVAPPKATGLTMPRRTHTREQQRQHSIEAERRLNDPYIAERNKPPPF
ncbi:HNH endonuclease signature motif containing protein [Mycobacterium sp. 3519A]|uniref:HNH endonuclease signature motif containing protein n=1 Tax=Mycobacterium sp. 3519A TaxID=2057184 RepID=UPI000C7A72FC|nr:HNH endonuclease signature motif containing protein [Mycobacterium sp. 3519A]